MLLASRACWRLHLVARLPPFTTRQDIRLAPCARSIDARWATASNVISTLSTTAQTYWALILYDESGGRTTTNGAAASTTTDVKAGAASVSLLCHMPLHRRAMTFLDNATASRAACLTTLMYAAAYHDVRLVLAIQHLQRVPAYSNSVPATLNRKLTRIAARDTARNMPFAHQRAHTLL